MEDEILVVMNDSDHIRVMRPTEQDSVAVVSTKMFLLTCLHRRNLDDDFDKEMLDWLDTHGLPIATRN